MGTFLRAQGHFASEMELTAIVRRIDQNGDATISDSEFADFLRPCGTPSAPPVPSSPKRSQSAGRYSSPLKGSSAGRSLSMSASPVRVSPSRTDEILASAARTRALMDDDLARARYYDSRYPYYYDRYSPYWSRYSLYPYDRYSPYYPYGGYPYYSSYREMLIRTGRL